MKAARQVDTTKATALMPRPTIGIYLFRSRSGRLRGTLAS